MSKVQDIYGHIQAVCPTSVNVNPTIIVDEPHLIDIVRNVWQMDPELRELLMNHVTYLNSSITLTLELMNNNLQLALDM